MRRRFFVDRFEEKAAVMRGDAARHLGKVLRAEPGQLYELSDGDSVWLSRIEQVSRDEVQFSLVELIPARLPKLRTTLLLSIVKFDRFEWCLEKATELGVGEIVPLNAARSEKALVVAAAKRAGRWGKILLESSQQSRRLSPPLLQPALRPVDAFRVTGTQHSVSICLSERREARPMREIMEGKRGESACLAIGPEGGWTDEELASAHQAGLAQVSLGQQILRTETAVIAALSMLNYALGE